MSLFYHPIRLTEEAQRDAYEVRLVIRAESERGCTVEMLAPEAQVAVTINGAAAEGIVRKRCGERWLSIALPAGRCEVRVDRHN